MKLIYLSEKFEISKIKENIFFPLYLILPYSNWCSVYSLIFLNN